MSKGHFKMRKFDEDYYEEYEHKNRERDRSMKKRQKKKDHDMAFEDNE